MSRERKTLLTLEERLALAAGSQASSPEAAARLVKQLSEARTLDLLGGNAGVEAMIELIGEFMDCVGEAVLFYRGFCHSIQMAINYDDDVFVKTHQGMPKGAVDSLYRPVFGTRVNNTIVLLGELLLEHAKGVMPNKDIYHSTRMTLEQYLDALVDLTFQEDGAQDSVQVEGLLQLGDVLLKDYGGSIPLGEALENILGRYIVAWQEFGQIDHILRCMDALACYLLENGMESSAGPDAESLRRFRDALLQYGPDLGGKELAEPDKQCQDPCGYYLNLANEHPDESPDLHSLDFQAEILRSRIFLPERDRRPETLRALAALSPSPDLRALLEKSISEERLSRAIRELNRATADLYVLWVAPYLKMEKFHYERHLK